MFIRHTATLKIFVPMFHCYPTFRIAKDIVRVFLSCLMNIYIYIMYIIYNYIYYVTVSTVIVLMSNDV